MSLDNFGHGGNGGQATATTTRMPTTTRTAAATATPLPVSLEGSPLRVRYHVTTTTATTVDTTCDATTVDTTGTTHPQQPMETVLAQFADTLPLEIALHGACQVAVNAHFLLYGLPQTGLIRVMHRRAPLRALLRAHQGQVVTDLQFFQGGDVLASAGSTPGGGGSPSASSIVIWRIFEQSQQICSETLLEISSSTTTMTRVLWHPFNPNQFWMLHHNAKSNHTTAGQQATVATLVETTRIATTPHPADGHPIADWSLDDLLLDGAAQVRHNPPTSSSAAAAGAGASLTDLAWCGRDTRYCLACFSNGDVQLLDLKTTHLVTMAGPTGGGAFAVPHVVRQFRHFDDDSEGVDSVTRAMFLPHENTVPSHSKSAGGDNTLLTSCFVIGSHNNNTLTFYSAFGGEKNTSTPTKLQELCLNPRESYVLGLCSHHALSHNVHRGGGHHSPLSSFLTAASRESGVICAFHLRAQQGPQPHSPLLLVGADYVVPFCTKSPNYSYVTVSKPATDLVEEDWDDNQGVVFDMELYTFQPGAVQCLTLTSFMCLPPDRTYMDPTPGVTFQRLVPDGSRKAATAATAVISDIDDEDEFEPYDVDGNSDDGEPLDDDDDEGGPEASALPMPMVGKTTTTDLINNPFANWLGSMAAKSAVAAKAKPVESPSPSPPQPPAPFQSPAPPTIYSPPPGVTPLPPSSFLVPTDIVSRQAPVADATPPVGVRASANTSRQTTPTIQNTQRSRHADASPGVDAVHDVNNNQGRENMLTIEDIRQVVRDEVNMALLPSLKQAVGESLHGNESKSLALLEPLQASVKLLSEQGVTVDHRALATSVVAGLHDPIRAAFAESIKTVVIPALESVTGQVLGQVSQHLERHSHDQSALDSISKQLSTMTALVAELTNEVQSLRSAVAAAKPSEAPSVGPKPSHPVPPPLVDVRNAILRLLKERNYGEAFTKALSTKSVEMTVFCCRNANLQDVLGGTQPVLSQPILLCLMQQLGTLLLSSPDSELQMELDWLQEIALSLNPADPDIQQHVPKVLAQVVPNINQRMQVLSDPQLRRSLQRMLQVIRGMQMG